MKYFAVIGNPISHSRSPQMMNAGFSLTGTEGFYSRVLLSHFNDFDHLDRIIDFKGCNVTAPFKSDSLNRAVLKEESALNTGVCNTIVKNNSNGAWTAHNTDIVGVLHPLIAKIGELHSKKCLVLGAGGAARAVMQVLSANDSDIHIFNRTVEKAKMLVQKFGGHVVEDLNSLSKIFLESDVIINTLPVVPAGMEGIVPKKDQLFFDATYKEKPFAPYFETDADNYLDGLSWLIAQGTESFRLFTGKPISPVVFKDALEQKMQFTGNKLFLIGPMGAGKTSIAKVIARISGYRWYDLDNEIELKRGKTVSRIFEEDGEEKFREYEAQVLKEIQHYEKVIVSCGGGIIKKFENRKILSQNHTVLLMVSPETSVRRNNNTRPLLIAEDPLDKASEILNQRLDHYIKTAHVIVNGETSTPEELAELIWNDFRNTLKA